MSLRKAGHGAFVFIFLAVALTGCSKVAPPPPVQVSVVAESGPFRAT